MDKQKTGELIKRARIEKGLTQLELGEIIGVSNKAVSRWENGETFPDVELLDGISNALGVGIEELVLGGKTKEANERVLTDLVHQVRIQQKQREIWLVKVFVLLLELVWIGVLGYMAFSGNVNGHSCWRYIISMVPVLALTVFVEPVKQSGKLRNFWNVFSVLAVLYIIVLMAAVIWMMMNGTVPFSMRADRLGPFMAYQFAAVFVLEFLGLVFYGINVIKSDGAPVGNMLVCEIGVFLSMGYCDLLHGFAVSLQNFWNTVLIETLWIVGLGIAAMAACQLKKWWRYRA